jgi:hypothetical protein
MTVKRPLSINSCSFQPYLHLSLFPLLSQRWRIFNLHAIQLLYVHITGQFDIF